MANPVAQAAVEAVELEAWDSRIRDLVYKAVDAVREICPMCNRKMPRKIACAKDNSEVA